MEESMKNNRQKMMLAHLGMILLSITMFGAFFIFNLHLLQKLSSSGLNVIGVYGILLFLILFEIGLYLMIYKIAKQISSFQKPFDFLKKREPIDDRQIILMGLRRLPYSYPMVQVEQGIDMMIENRKIAIRVLKGKGLLKGKKEDTEWILHGTKVGNPFPKDATCYLVKEEAMMYQVEGVFIGSISQIVFKIENLILNYKPNS